MNLYLYPEAASHKDGYGIAVCYDYLKQPPNSDDVVVWLTTYDRKKMLYVRDSDYILERAKLLSLNSILNLIKGRNRSELSFEDLLFLKDYNFDTIHCDDVLFYKAIRSIFPHQQIRIRFHNCFSRIEVRNQFLKRDVGLRYKYALKIMKNLESEIFNDEEVYKIFISDEDRDFYTSTYGVFGDSETWSFNPNRELIAKNRHGFILKNKIVWFGGVEAHKESSVRWFINNVFPQIKIHYPDMEFHLWGRNTKVFDSPKNNIWGHGFFEGTGMPVEDALYVNPDIIGGGVKMKLMTLMENGVPFISTPFGFEGYCREWIDNEYCIVEEENKWAGRIIDFFSSHSVK